jgi:hypothetical protein
VPKSGSNWQLFSTFTAISLATFYADRHRESVWIVVNLRSIRSSTGRGRGRPPPGKSRATWRWALRRRSGWRAWFSGFRGRVLPRRTRTGTRWQDSTAPSFFLTRPFPAAAAPKLAGMPSKGDELYEARDLRIVLIDSPDPEVRSNPSRFTRL